MTTLVAWCGVDSRGPASIYLASESRISWGKAIYWDYGRKVFASSTTPDIFAYAGDVLFPSLVLGQIIELIEKGLCFDPVDTAEIKKQKIFQILKDAFINYPKSEQRNFTIVYCTRENLGMDSVFWAFTIIWDCKKGWAEDSKEMPQKSDVIARFGSGGKFLDKWQTVWNMTTEKGTSRIVFSAFCKALYKSEDPHSGGSPQLVGLYRKGNGKTFGIIYKGKRYLLGSPIITEPVNLKNPDIEWRNDLFENCSGYTKKRLLEEQKHISLNNLDYKGKR